MPLDPEPHSACANSSAPERQHEIASPRAVRRIHDDRQSVHMTQNRNGPEVEQVARRIVESANPTLTKDHTLRTMREQILARKKPLVDGR